MHAPLLSWTSFFFLSFALTVKWKPFSSIPGEGSTEWGVLFTSALPGPWIWLILSGWLTLTGMSVCVGAQRRSCPPCEHAKAVFGIHQTQWGQFSAWNTISPRALQLHWCGGASAVKPNRITLQLLPLDVASHATWWEWKAFWLCFFLTSHAWNSVVNCFSSLIKIYLCIRENESVSCSVVFDSLRPQRPQPTRLLCPWDSPGKNTGVGSHFLLQGIFPTRDPTRVSCIAGRFFTIWATREALCIRDLILEIFHLLPVEFYHWIASDQCHLIFKVWFEDEAVLVRVDIYQLFIQWITECQRVKYSLCLRIKE